MCGKPNAKTSLYWNAKIAYQMENVISIDLHGRGKTTGKHVVSYVLNTMRFKAFKICMYFNERTKKRKEKTNHHYLIDLQFNRWDLLCTSRSRYMQNRCSLFAVGKCSPHYIAACISCVYATTSYNVKIC